MPLQDHILDKHPLDTQILDGDLFQEENIALRLEVNNKTMPLKTGTFELEEEIESRSIANFIVKDLENQYVIKERMPINIQHVFSGTSIFKGYVKDVNKTPITNTGEYFHEVVAVDNHYLADKRRVALLEENILAGDVARQIVDNYLAEEGVTYTSESIQDGVEMTRVNFNYIPISRALNVLAENVNFWWKITKDKVLKFKEISAEDASWTLTSDEIIGQPSVERNNPKYRNKQFVKSVRDLTDTQVETFVGDGEKRTFTVNFPINEDPTVKVDRGSGYVEEDATRKSGDFDSPWYWETGDHVLKQDSSETVLSSSDKLRISYVGRFNIVAETKDEQEIDRVKQIEGSSGIVEDTANRPDLRGRESAIETGNSLLVRYAKEGKKVQYRTRTFGLKSGQLQPVEGLTELGIEEGEELLIRKVTTRDTQGILFREVEAVKGPLHDQWKDIFGDIKDQLDRVVEESDTEDQILTLTYSFSKTWQETEDPNIFKEVYPATDLYPSTSLYPMFNPNEKVKYLAWLDSNGNELGRKQVSQEDITDTQVYTLTYLGATEANVTMASLAWYGGYRASSGAETGIKLDQQAHSETKTNSEAWQIEKTDDKGW